MAMMEGYTTGKESNDQVINHPGNILIKDYVISCYMYVWFFHM